jgi:hypothetical protein
MPSPFATFYIDQSIGWKVLVGLKRKQSHQYNLSIHFDRRVLVFGGSKLPPEYPNIPPSSISWPTNIQLFPTNTKQFLVFISSSPQFEGVPAN